MPTYTLNAGHVRIEDIVRIAHDPAEHIALAPETLAAIERSRATVNALTEKRAVVYGLTTGFGKFKDRFIDGDHIAELQVNLLRSHSVGVGMPFPLPWVRAMMVIRLNSLARGFSGVRPELLNLLVGMLNANVTPEVPSKGSVGSSGDLAPLSHMGLVLMGEGFAWYKGERLIGAEALKRAGLQPIQFASKEGLAWNNGTSVQTGVGTLATHLGVRLTKIADIAAALSMEAHNGLTAAYDPRPHQLRGHEGQIVAAANILELLKGSTYINSGTAAKRVQDAYSLRCAPQVHGATREAIRYAEHVMSTEVNAVTDNPLIFADTAEAISAGNFHGEPVAIAMDTLGIAVSELANISERRTAKLLDSATNEGLPMFLIPPERGGLHNGYMIAQYTAAALVSENKVLAHPASVDSIPTSANQEDHVSMGTIAARKAMEIAGNAVDVFAIEFMCATQGVDLREKAQLGVGTRAAYDVIRGRVPMLDGDRILAPDMQAIAELIRDGSIEAAVVKAGVQLG
ncbi:MAG: histidine ammonia-lyase [bacterium]|nr:histidine ammonia-lyase [bacterium]